jgi:chemotaxis protein CheX
MATAADTSLERLIPGNTTLLRAVVPAVEGALEMCGRRARCVGVATVPASVLDPGVVTGMIGVHGDVSGFVTVNLAEKSAISIVGAMLQDRFDRITNQVVDGVGEIANMVTGGIKSGLLGTPWSFRSVTVPSVIVGRNYQIAYTKGIEFLAVTFEHEDEDAFLLQDRLMHVAISLMRL